MSNTPEMKFLVVELYVAVFNFLCDAMDWYGGSRKRRIMGSFRQNYADDIRKNTDKIKEALDRIRLEADQATQSRVQDTHQDMRGVLHEMKSMSQKLERLEAAAEKDRQNPTASAAAFENLAEQFMLVLGQRAMRTLVATGEAQRGKLWSRIRGPEYSTDNLTRSKLASAHQHPRHRRQEVTIIPTNFWR